MGGATSSNQTIPRLATDNSRSGGVPAPDLAGLGARNRARLAQILLDGLASLATTSRSDELLRAFLLARLTEIDAALVEDAAVAS